MPPSGKRFFSKYPKIFKIFWKVVGFCVVCSKKFACFRCTFEKPFVFGCENLCVFDVSLVKFEF